MNNWLSKIFIVLIGVGFLIVSSNINWYKNSWLRVIQTDAKGYYAYLPALFIYQDLNFGFFDEIEKEKYYHPTNQSEYRVETNGKYVDKYFCGVAIMQAPFFLTAHALSGSLGYASDGYSRIYIILITLGAIFYLCIGLFFLDKILEGYDVSTLNRIFTFLAIVFGTHAFYYTIGEPGMSHVYSFALIAAFLYYSRQYFTTLSLKLIPLIALIYGLIALVRPANMMVILLLPFAAGELFNLTDGASRLFKKPLVLAMGVIFFIALVALQPLYYKLAIGEYFTDTYGGEAFHLLQPHFWAMLFSYKKGVFLYTPLLLISLFGFYFLWKRNAYQALTLGLFLATLNYILSSWWSWWYGGSFSSRVYVEYIPLFGILLALALQDLKKALPKAGFIILILGCLALNQIQTYQYRYQMIHWEDMNKEKYWDVFLKLP